MSASKPMSRNRGSQLSAMKSAVGAMGLCVPPSRRTVDGPSARASAGSTVCSTKVVEPALPVAKL